MVLGTDYKNTKRCRWLLVTGTRSLIEFTGYWLLVTGTRSLIEFTGYWLLVTRTLIVVAGYTKKTVPAIETSANALGGI